MRLLSPGSAVLLLSAGIILSIVLFLATSFTRNSFYQDILLLISMGAIFYSSHPLAHYVIAVFSRVGVRYFFVSRSDFRRLGGPLGALGKSLVTIGVKLEPAQVRQLSRSRRAFLFGSGAIVSNVLLAFELLSGLLTGLSSIALALGTLLFLASVATELFFSTKVGDLRKMQRELSR
jgi:hypothetical protein